MPAALVVTVESLDAPHVVLGDVPLSGVGGIGMHQSLRVSGVPQTQSVADLVCRHLDQVVQPDSCRRDHMTAISQRLTASANGREPSGLETAALQT